MNFSEKLRELKGEMSESALAKASGLPFPSVHSYVLGRRTPTFAAVVRIARALGTNCEAFSDCEDIAGDEANAPLSPPAPPPKRGRPAKPAAETPPAKKPDAASATFEVGGKKPRKRKGKE